MKPEESMIITSLTFARVGYTQYQDDAELKIKFMNILSEYSNNEHFFGEDK